MKWISLEDEQPNRCENVLVNRTVYMGGYEEGIYIGMYTQYSESNEYIFIIRDDGCINKNNWRPLEEFSHFMALPERPYNIDKDPFHFGLTGGV